MSLSYHSELQDSLKLFSMALAELEIIRSGHWHPIRAQPVLIWVSKIHLNTPHPPSWKGTQVKSLHHNSSSLLVTSFNTNLCVGSTAASFTCSAFWVPHTERLFPFRGSPAAQGVPGLQTGWCPRGSPPGKWQECPLGRAAVWNAV